MADQTNRTNEREKEMQHTVEERGSLVRDEGVQIEAPAREQNVSIHPEYEPGKASGTAKDSHESQCDSSSLLTAQKYSRRSSSSSDAYQTDTGADCAGIVLNCLFCRFYDLCLMLPDSCERAAFGCCPAYKQFSDSVETAPSNDWKCNCDFDCGLFDACQETGDCLELAMEMSEICYH